MTFNGKVSFSNVTDVPQLGSSPQEVVTAINAGNTTTINGGRITTGSITANSLSANAITGKYASFDNSNGTVNATVTGYPELTTCVNIYSTSSSTGLAVQGGAYGLIAQARNRGGICVVGAGEVVDSIGVQGSSTSREGTVGVSKSGNGVFGTSDTGVGVIGYGYYNRAGVS